MSVTKAPKRAPSRRKTGSLGARRMLTCCTSGSGAVSAAGSCSGCGSAGVWGSLTPPLSQSPAASPAESDGRESRDRGRWKEFLRVERPRSGSCVTQLHDPAAHPQAVEGCVRVEHHHPSLGDDEAVVLEAGEHLETEDLAEHRPESQVEAPASHSAPAASTTITAHSGGEDGDGRRDREPDEPGEADDHDGHEPEHPPPRLRPGVRLVHHDPLRERRSVGMS